MADQNKEPEIPRQEIIVYFAGSMVRIPIYITNVTARDLELQKKAWLSACEEAFYEYLYVNRLGRYSMIPKEGAPEKDNEESA